jgi:hypothetical protein
MSEIIYSEKMKYPNKTQHTCCIVKKDDAYRIDLEIPNHFNTRIWLDFENSSCTCSTSMYRRDTLEPEQMVLLENKCIESIRHSILMSGNSKTCHAWNSREFYVNFAELLHHACSGANDEGVTVTSPIFVPEDVSTTIQGINKYLVRWRCKYTKNMQTMTVLSYTNVLIDDFYHSVIHDTVNRSKNKSNAEYSYAGYSRDHLNGEIVLHILPFFHDVQ